MLANEATMAENAVDTRVPRRENTKYAQHGTFNLGGKVGAKILFRLICDNGAVWSLGLVAGAALHHIAQYRFLHWLSNQVARA